MTAIFPVIETPTTTPPTSGLKKVSHYYHINDALFLSTSAYTSYAYRVNSFIVNNVELVPTPITSSFWTSQPTVTIPAQPFERHLIPAFIGGNPPGTWDYDPHFVDFLNSLGIPNFTFYPEGLSGYLGDMGRGAGDNFHYRTQFIGGSGVDGVYGDGVQIERPENDIFRIEIDCLYNGSSTAGHTMVFMNNGNTLDGVQVMSKYGFSGNTY